ncbi:MAG: TonB-dependent receptor [Bacteroidota bacterium]
MALVPRLALATALGLLISLPAQAQRPGTPTGSVAATIVDDAAGAPLPQATLALYSARDTSFVTGGAADVDGRVEIDPVRPGSYVARVSFIGYETSRLDAFEVAAGAPTDLGEIRLMEGAALLGEAEVTAEREFVEQQADRTVYNVQEQAVTAGGSAIETLQTLPALEVDTDGNISLRGNQNVVIQINGRPTPVRGAFLAALLRQIPAEKVDRVEVIPNPSARFEAEGMAGIVNIVLAEGVERGLSGGLTFGGGTELSGNVGANLSYQRGDWDLNGQYGLRYGQRDVDVASLTRIDGGLSRNAFTLNESDELSHFFTGSAEYVINDQTTLRTETSFGLRGGGEDGTARFEDRQDEGVRNVTRIDDGDNDGYNGDIALVFRRQFENAGGGGEGGSASAGGGRRGGPPGMFRSRGGGGTQSDHELAIEGRFTRFNNEGLGVFEDFDLESVVLGAQSQFNDQTNDEGRLQLDYTRPVGQTTIETGALGVFEWVASETELLIGDDLGSLAIDPNQTNAFDYDRQVGAAYLQASRAFGSVQLQGGVRMEATQRAFDLVTEVPEAANPFFDPEAETSASYVDLFPSVFATYSFAPGTLVKGSYRRSINRPETSSLNPFPDLSDTTFVRVGNPGLQPEYTDSIELTLQYKFFATLAPFFRRTTNSIARRVSTDQETGVGVFSVANLDSETNYGADLTLFGQFGPVRGFVSSSVFQAVLTDPTPGQEEVNDLAWNARASLQLEVREGTNLQSFVFYNGPRESVDGRRRAFAFSTIGINQRISEQLSLSARLNDPFRLATFEFETNDGRVFRDTSFDPNIRQASFTLTYTFGSNQNRPRPQQQQQGGMDDGFAI